MNRVRILISIALCVLMLVGCAGSTEPASNTPTPEPMDTTEPLMETYTIFTIDTTSMQIVPSQVRSDSSEEELVTICNLVQDNLEYDDIHVVEAEHRDDTGIVVFDSTGKPVTGCDEDMEYLILDCFSNSILDNVDGCHNVVFRTDKGAYISDNLQLEEDEIYASK